MKWNKRSCWNCLFKDYSEDKTLTCSFKLDEYGYPERMEKVTMGDYRCPNIAEEYETPCKHFVDKEDVINRERERLLRETE